MRFISNVFCFFVFVPFLMAQQMDSRKPYPEFALGVSGIYATIDDGKVIVQKVLKNTPADGFLKKGDILSAVNGKSLNIKDPRPLIGQALNEADGSGKLTVIVNGKKLTLKFPVIGSYADTWPIKCKKSQTLISTNAAFLAASQQRDGSYKISDRPIRDDLTGCLAGLFLLSTGEKKYLKNVKLQVRALADKVRMHPTNSNWHLGYQGILIAEYYLKTGDRSVLKGLESLCRQAEKVQAAGGWGHGGQINSPGYVQSGLMNSAGIPVLKTLILARECGIKVNPENFKEAVKFGMRFAGRGCAPYGDHRPELDWSNTNGRNGKLAVALNLLPEKQYKMAAQHFAMLVADSYFQPEFGHTGGGFNVIWRGIASSLIPGSKRSHYHRQLNTLSWYYDLSRLPEGGFSILPTPPNKERYSDITWGTGAIGLTHTAPLRTLRITGMPPTRYSKKLATPKIEFGTAEDLKFLQVNNADGYGSDKYAPHEIYDLTIGHGKEKADTNLCIKFLYHYNPMVRAWAVKRLNNTIKDNEVSKLKKLLAHKDPRVRRAAYDVISGYTNWGRPFRSRVGKKEASRVAINSIEKVLSSQTASWWEKDAALLALGKCEPKDIRKNIKSIMDYSRHPDWYLRESAFWSLVGLENEINDQEIELLGSIYKNSERAFVRSSYDAGFKHLLKSKRVELKEDIRSKLVSMLGYTTHSPKVAYGYGEGALHEATHRTMMVMSKFDDDAFKFMISDITQYLDQKWLPYFQHSVWLIKGSKWQPGFIQVMNKLGKDGKPIRDSLSKILTKYSEYDKQRIKQGRAEDIQEFIATAVKQWDSKFGK